MDPHLVTDIEEIFANGVSCLAHKCYNTRILKPELVYYKLPKEEESCKIWLRNAGRYDLLQMPLEVVQRNYHLCEEHFERKLFRKPEWKASLNYYQNPVPTIFRNNIKDFAPEQVQDAYEAKKKREEFMRKFPDYESHTSDEEMEYNEFEDDRLSSDTEIKDEQDMFESNQNGDELIEESELFEKVFVYENKVKPNPCRFCTFPVDEDAVYIFAQDEDSKKIQEMINVVLPAQVHENDGLPHHMCLMCIDKLKQCYETILAYFAAEAFFRSQELREDVVANEDGDLIDNGDEKSTEEVTEDLLQADADHLTNGDLESEENYENIEANSAEEDGTEEVSLKCGLCFAVCSSLRDLVLHRKIKHPRVSLMKKRYYCMKCPMIFMKANTLKSHMQSTHPPEEKDYPCDDCEMVFKLKYLLNNHRKVSHRKHTCEECGKSFYYPVLLKRHMRKHDDSAKCSFCDKEFKNAYWRRIHEKKHTAEGCHLCWVCGKVFHLRTSLHWHVQSHSKTHKCEICGKCIATLSGLRKHQALHKEREKIYKCTTCSKAFFSKQLLKQHNLCHTGVRPHVCHCGASFNRLSNLNYHKKRHLESYQNKSKPVEKASDSEVYKCDLCNKEITSKLTYKYHIARHTGNKKPFDCEECGLTFSTTYSYRTHVRIHTGERPFVCKVENCGLGFRSKSTLQQHEIVHMDDRPFVCPICPVSFKRLYSLNMHKTTHSALRPYQCTICERAFARKPDARIHVMRQHSISNAEVYEYLLEVVNEEGNNDELTFPYIIEEELSESTVTDEIPEMVSATEEIVESIEPGVYNVVLS